MDTWTNSIISTSRYAIRSLDALSLPYKPAIVFDVDSTLFDTNGISIIPIHNIYRYAQMIGLSIVIVTSRIGIHEVIEFTENQLASAGLYGVKLSYFRKSRFDDHWKFKQRARLNVQEKGYNIVMTVGDQDWDIMGDYTGIGIKVPLPNDVWVKESYSQTQSTPRCETPLSLFQTLHP